MKIWEEGIKKMNNKIHHTNSENMHNVILIEQANNFIFPLDEWTLILCTFFHGQFWILKGQEAVKHQNILSMKYNGCGSPHVYVVICTCIKAQLNAVWSQVSRVQVPQASGGRKIGELRRFLFEMWSGGDMSWFTVSDTDAYSVVLKFFFQLLTTEVMTS